MFLDYMPKRFVLLFPFAAFLAIIISSHTLSSVSGFTPASYNYSSTFSSPASNSSLPFTQNETNNASSSSFKITEQLKSLLNERVDKNKTNAAIAIGLVNPNGIQFYGHGKLSREYDKTVDINSIFAIGSNTKVFTAILLADLVHKGLVKLDDPIEKYLPTNVKIPEYKGHKITLENLATHTSALPEWPSNYCFGIPSHYPPNETIKYRLNTMNCGKNYTFNQLHQALSNTTLPREPGSKFEYSTFGSALLGHILTLKSNMSSFDELLANNILNVLGMDSTNFNPSDLQKSRLAVGHFNSRELPIWNLSKPLEPGGGLYSSIGDMLKFLSANIGLINTKLDNTLHESHLIRHSTGLLLPNNLKATSNDNLGYYIGLGWIVTTNYGQEIIWHNGATPGGYNAFMAFNPTTERGVVILTSADVANNNIAGLMFKSADHLSSLITGLLDNPY